MKSSSSFQRMRRRTPLLGGLLMLTLHIAPLEAADRIWNYTGSNWGDAGAWNGGAISSNRDIFYFNRTPGATVHNDLNSFVLRGLVFGVDAATHQLTGNAFTFGSPTIVNNQSAVSQDLRFDITLAGATEFRNSHQSGKLLIKGAISGAVNSTITGPGTTVFSGKNTNTGSTTISGHLMVDFSEVVPSENLYSASSAMVGLGGKFTVKGKAIGPSEQTINALSIMANNGLTLATDASAGGAVTLTIGAMTRADRSTLNIDVSKGGTVAFTALPPGYAYERYAYATVRDAAGVGFATQSGSLVVRATDATALPGTGAETAASGHYATSGDHTLTGASLLHTLEIDGTAGSGSLALTGDLRVDSNGGILHRGNHDYTISGGRLTTHNNNIIHFHVMDEGDLIVNSTMTAGTFFAKNGSGRLILGGDQSAVNGIISVSEGVVQLNTDNTKARFYLAVDDGLQFGSGMTDVTVGLVHSSGLSGVRQKLENIDGEAVNLRVGTAANYAGSLYGSGSLTVAGGVQTFSGLHSFTGGTVVEGGTLVLTLAYSLSAVGDITVNGGTLGSTTWNLNQETSGEIRLLAGTIISATSSTNRGTLRKLGGGFFEMHAGTVGERVILAGDGAGLRKLSAGTVTLDSLNSTYTGETRIEAGKLVVNGIIVHSSGFNIDAGATLGGVGSVSRISGAGTVAPGNSPGMLTSTDVDPTGGLDFSFEVTRAASGGESAPDFANLSNIGNDVLYLTQAAPFTAALTAANVITVDFSAITLSLGDVYLGGFFATTDFGADLANATFQFIGVGEEYFISTSTLAHTANFTGGAVSGYITAFEVQAIPEPGSVAMLIGSGLLLAGYWRRRSRCS